MTERLRINISGDVVGVGFRYWTLTQAKRLGIRGYVRNAADDMVEIVAFGAREKLDELVRLCHKGPEVAWVEKVAVREEKSGEEYKEFVIIR